jgi:uncharacterized tellurite resistance protein B-like protein
MSRWSKYIGNSVNFAVDKAKDEGFLESFFESRAFEPKNEQEAKEYEDFCFVSSALSLAVYVSLADQEVSEEEKERIVTEMIYQLEQRQHEHLALSEKFGNADREIVNTLFEKFKDEIQSGNYDQDNNLRIINMVYRNNPYKRYFLLRLCFMIGYADSRNIEKKLNIINKIAKKLSIDDREKERIRQEVAAEYKRK